MMIILLVVVMVVRKTRRRKKIRDGDYHISKNVVHDSEIVKQGLPVMMSRHNCSIRVRGKSMSGG